MEIPLFLILLIGTAVYLELQYGNGKAIGRLRTRHKTAVFWIALVCLLLGMVGYLIAWLVG